MKLQSLLQFSISQFCTSVHFPDYDATLITIIIAVSQIGDNEKTAKFYHLDFGSNSIQPIADHPYGNYEVKVTYSWGYVTRQYPHEGRAIGTFKGKYVKRKLCQRVISF